MSLHDHIYRYIISEQDDNGFLFLLDQKRIRWIRTNEERKKEEDEEGENYENRKDNNYEEQLYRG
jgi:hypothetical protein